MDRQRGVDVAEKLDRQNVRPRGRSSSNCGCFQCADDKLRCFGRLGARRPSHTSLHWIRDFVQREKLGFDYVRPSIFCMPKMRCILLRRQKAVSERNQVEGGQCRAELGGKGVGLNVRGDVFVARALCKANVLQVKRALLDGHHRFHTIIAGLGTRKCQ